jgi:cobalamin biosynthesis protein CobC
MLEHGGNLALAAKQYGIALEHWLDLSTGINPQGYPIPAIPAQLWQRLPLENDGLIEAACAFYGCQFVLPTAGSQAALQALPQLRAPCKIAMPRTMYQEHAQAWQRHDHTLSFFDDKPNQATLEQADVVLLCNPNNPTAMQFSPEYLLKLHAQLAARGSWLILDEAFIDATPSASIAAHTHLEGLFVLRSLGKFFGLAGARVGFLLAPKHWLNKAQEIIGPWTLTGASRFIALQALSDGAWQVSARIQLAADSARLTDLLSKYGLVPAAKTRLFQFVLTPRAIETQQALAQQGVWVRLFAEVTALRFGLPPENAWDKLESALENIALF